MQKKTKMIYTNKNLLAKQQLLIEMTINYAIDMWIFRELFINCKNTNYEDTYKQNWKDISRMFMNKENFNIYKELLEVLT